MKYIKRLNIDFNNWDEINEYKYNIGDRVVLIINNPVYIDIYNSECDYITKDEHYNLGQTHIKIGRSFIIEYICTNKDITYLKFKNHWPWFFAEDFARYK